MRNPIWNNIRRIYCHSKVVSTIYALLDVRTDIFALSFFLFFWLFSFALSSGVEVRNDIISARRTNHSLCGHCTIKDLPVVVYYSRHCVFTWRGDRCRYHNSLSCRRSSSKSKLGGRGVGVPPYGSDSNSDIKTSFTQDWGRTNGFYRLNRASLWNTRTVRDRFLKL